MFRKIYITLLFLLVVALVIISNIDFYSNKNGKSTVSEQKVETIIKDTPRTSFSIAKSIKKCKKNIDDFVACERIADEEAKQMFNGLVLYFRENPRCYFWFVDTTKYSGLGIERFMKIVKGNFIAREHLEYGFIAIEQIRDDPWAGRPFMPIPQLRK